MQQQPNYQPPYPSSFGHQPILVVNRTPFKVRLAVIALLLLVTYIGFSVASLYPSAKSEFVYRLLNPNFSLSQGK